MVDHVQYADPLMSEPTNTTYVQPMSPLRKAEVDLNAAIERLENRAVHVSDTLPERFTAVLLPPSPNVSGEVAERLLPHDRETMSPLAATFALWAARINEAVDRIERTEGELLNRCDL